MLSFLRDLLPYSVEPIALVSLDMKEREKNECDDNEPIGPLSSKRTTPGNAQ